MLLRLMPQLVLVGIYLQANAARADDVMALVRADRWPEAQAAAGEYLDPVVGKLVTYYRLLAPHAATQEEISAFQAANPDWPFQSILTRRQEEAEANTADESALPSICGRTTPSMPATQLRCADVLARAARVPEAIPLANAAWVGGDDALIARAQSRWGSSITRNSQWRRFDRLAWVDTSAAARQISRLDPADRPSAEARLALRRDAANAEALVTALPQEAHAEPGVMLEHARFLRRANRDDQAVVLWDALGTIAEKAASPDRRAAFWDERNIMARRRLRAGDAQGAYRITAGHAQTGSEQIGDAEFLAGFIALRRLKDPVLATKHFQRLAAISKAAITQGRAHYWLGRAGGGRAEYEQAAAWLNTFYGQLAIIALGQNPVEPIRAARTPLVEPERALDLAGREVARAAAYLVVWGENHRAQTFLFRLDEIAPDTVDRRLVARLAYGFGLVDTAVALARRAGRDGLIEIDTGWPAAATIPPELGVDPALALGIIRQESSFDTTTMSPVGARGLMQLMPGTAAEVARGLGTPAPLPALLNDPSLNVRLGTTYLRGLLNQFGDVVPFAVAGYNAGPGRVADWMAAAGDPRTGADVIDWIELIPFNETRNYVQRVIENQVVYTALASGTAPHPLAQWLK